MLSYQSLTPELQFRWCALSVFPGLFDMAAASAIWQTDADQTQDVLGKLATQSLIEWHPERTRYRLHDLARVFADSRLTSDARTISKENLACHYESILREANVLATKDGEDIQYGADLLELEWENIKLGQELATIGCMQQDEKASRLCIAYHVAGKRILALRRGLSTRIRWAETALAAARLLQEQSVEKDVANYLGAAYMLLGQASRAVEFHDQCLGIARGLQDRLAETTALCGLGTAYFRLGEETRGLEHYQRAIEIALSLNERDTEARMIWGLGILYANAGQVSQSLDCYQRAKLIAQELGDRHLEAHVLESMSWSVLSQKKSKDAINLLTQATKTLRIDRLTVVLWRCHT